MKKRVRIALQLAALAIGGLLIALLCLEMGIRILGETDKDGQFWFMGNRLEPYALPMQRLTDNVNAYAEKGDQATIIYDAATGWTYRPNSTRQDGDFTINSDGFRSQRDYSRLPAPDTLRIASFGDSFTAGVDVDDHSAWNNQLELSLRQAGYRAEVLNFGVGGYGMGQALLRWRQLGKDFQPDIVIFGFQPENLNRNVNVFRSIYRPETAIPFSKPRFVLAEGGAPAGEYPSRAAA